MAPVALGVDLGGTNVRAAIVDRESGEVIASYKEPLRDRTPGSVVEVIRHAVGEAAVAAGTSPAACAKAGVGVAGQVLGETGVVLNSPNLGWRDVPFARLLEAALGIPVRVANDLAVAAWGERRFGAAREIDDVILVFVGSGVGSGLILGGRLHGGAAGVAGEFGHVKVRPLRPETKVRRCGCGELSCLESYVSGVNVAARVREDLQAGAATLIRDMVCGDLARASASHVEEAYCRGDAYARALWEENGDLLGTATANYITTLNPARLILGGGVLLGCPRLDAIVRKHVDEKVLRAAHRGLSVEHAFLGDDAGVIGAALLE
jgi:glucokinase